MSLQFFFSVTAGTSRVSNGAQTSYSPVADYSLLKRSQARWDMLCCICARLSSHLDMPRVSLRGDSHSLSRLSSSVPHQMIKLTMMIQQKSLSLMNCFVLRHGCVRPLLAQKSKPKPHLASKEAGHGPQLPPCRVIWHLPHGHWTQLDYAGDRSCI